MKNRPIRLFLVLFGALGVYLVFAGPGGAEEKKDIGDRVNQKLDAFETWSKEAFKRFENEMNRDLDSLEHRLKNLRRSAGDRTNKTLEGVERELKDISRRLNDLGREKEPKKEDAQKIRSDLKKTEEKLNP